MAFASWWPLRELEPSPYVRPAAIGGFGEFIMSISIYDASVGVFQARLKGLAHVLTKAEANAAERKIEPAVLLGARLAPDMLNLIKQVQIATDHAKGAPSRLAGRDVPKFEDNEQSFADLQARIAKTLAHLATFTEADLEGGATRQIDIKAGPREMSFKGTQYLLGYATPNFYFHLTTAYAILRHNGIPLGKADFFGVSA